MGWGVFEDLDCKGERGVSTVVRVGFVCCVVVGDRGGDERVRSSVSTCFSA